MIHIYLELMSLADKQEYIKLLLGTFAHTASERGTRLTKLRLVKFLYLFDLYWAQSKHTTFTDWPWAFVHYGPYCRESTDAIDEATRYGYVTAEAYESQFRDEDYRLYGPGNRISEFKVDQVKTAMPLYVSARLFSAVRKFHDDTYELLDYVYFHTGPMARARPGERLSFADERELDFKQFQPVKMLSLHEKKRTALKEAVQRLRAKYPTAQDRASLYDEHYFDLISRIAGSETEPGTSGEATMKFELPEDD